MVATLTTTSFYADLRRDTDNLFEAIFRHPMVEELCAGTLPEQVERFAAGLPGIRAELGRIGFTIHGSDRYLHRIAASASGRSIPIDDCGPGRSFAVESKGSQRRFRPRQLAQPHRRHRRNALRVEDLRCHPGISRSEISGTQGRLLTSS